MDDVRDFALAKEGDHEALERLFARHISSVVQVLKRVLPPGEIEDVAQDVLLHSFVGFSYLRKPEVFGKWIRTIAYNRAMQWHRRRYKETALYPRIWEPSNSTDETEQIELRVDMNKALGLLSTADREAIVLRYVEGWTSSEIAQLHGEVASTIRWRLSKAVSSLKDILDGGVVEDDHAD